MCWAADWSIDSGSRQPRAGWRPPALHCDKRWRHNDSGKHASARPVFFAADFSEKALRVLKAGKYGASREKLGTALGQRGLFNEVETAVELTEVVGNKPALSATPLRETRSVLRQHCRGRHDQHRRSTHRSLPPSPRCRRCNGIVLSYPSLDENDRIYWFYLVCHDNGAISGWQNTLWDSLLDPDPMGIS
ncbi:hypothetical protein [Steroidobacter denitrificans]|uniref:hypothetical protein n=1 Tax=Steroidobacter denitrificans TaxID=465721 RepID=UPI001AEF9D13|nr:hypothetical protein [Steroidobacter denitrificans]